MKKIFTLFAAGIMAASLMAETVYFVNKAGWQNPNCYAWSGQGGEGNQNAAWPGEAMTKENYQLGGSDVYSYTANPAWENCIFNGGGQQTADLKWESGKYFDGTGWKTREELEGGNTGGDNPTSEGNPRYYWKGYVDGEDIEPTDATLFDGGISAISVMQDGYVFVLYQVDGQEGVQYMTTAYADGVSHATLSVNGGGKYEKMHIPAGDYTLYLYDNEDGTLELSTEVLPGKTLVGGGQGQAQGMEQTTTEKTVKFYQNGQICIRKNGQIYNALGIRL